MERLDLRSMSYTKAEEKAFIKWLTKKDDDGFQLFTIKEALEDIEKNGINKIFIFGFREGREYEAEQWNKEAKKFS